MTVYVEIVIINNLFLDLLLVVSTLTARRRKMYKLRILLAVTVGAAVAVGYAIAPFVWQIVIRILLAPIMAGMFDKYKSVKDYAVSLALFAMLTFALGGIISGTGHLLGIDPNGYVTLGLIALGAVLAIIALRVILTKRAAVKRKIKDVVIGFDGKETKISAMYDSGNSLTDTVSGLPVVIFSKNAESSLSDSGKIDLKNIEGYIEVGTVTGKSSLPLIKLDSIEVDGRRTNVYGALSGKDFDGYDVILQNTLF